MVQITISNFPQHLIRTTVEIGQTIPAQLLITIDHLTEEGEKDWTIAAQKVKLKHCCSLQKACKILLRKSTC